MKSKHATRVELDGRLGNHLFQIAAGYALCLKNGNPLKLDFSLATLLPFKSGALAAAMHIGRTMKVAPLRHPGLRRRFSRTFPEAGLGYTVFRRDHEYDLSFESLGPKTVLQGFYQNERYFKPHERDIRALFSDDMGIDASSTPYYEDILTSESVGVHIRRGDYLDAFFSHLLVCNLSYYNQAIDIFRRTSEKFRFFLFSDDPVWCKQHFPARDFTIIETQTPLDDPRLDFALLRRCRHHVMSNSTFSWWASWLNPYSKKNIICPDRWSTDNQIRLETKRFERLQTLSEATRAGLLK
ncbi:MAG TPA: alpha-1,2-fucosyltransferase [Chryseolinea sp.]